jgi:hypothetical protein
MLEPVMGTSLFIQVNPNKGSGQVKKDQPDFKINPAPLQNAEPESDHSDDS